MQAGERRTLPRRLSSSANSSASSTVRRSVMLLRRRSRRAGRMCLCLWLRLRRIRGVRSRVMVALLMCCLLRRWRCGGEIAFGGVLVRVLLLPFSLYGSSGLGIALVIGTGVGGMVSSASLWWARGRLRLVAFCHCCPRRRVRLLDRRRRGRDRGGMVLLSFGRGRL